MNPRWEDVNARARGLATHLLRRDVLEALARHPDLAALGAALRTHGYPLEEGEAAPEALELGLRRMAAARLRVLARRDFAGMISVAIEGPEGSKDSATTVELGSPAAEAIWVVAS